MGGFASGLGKILVKGSQKILSKIQDSPLGREVLSLAGNKYWELDLTAGGKAARKMGDEYERIHSSALHEETKKVKAIIDWHRNDPVARNRFHEGTSTLGEYHIHASSTQHPISKITGDLLQEDINPATGISENASKTYKELLIRAESKARLAAIEGSYGDHFQNIAPIIAAMRIHPDPHMQLNAQRIADIISNQVRDTEKITSFGGSSTAQSRAKTLMNKSFTTINKYGGLLQKGATEGTKIPLLDTGATYFKPSEAERMTDRALRTALIPFVAIPHIAQYAHYMADSPVAHGIGKALIGMDRAEMQKTVEATAITADTEWNILYEDILARTGKVAKWTNSPTAGQILGRCIHEPGFNWMRKKQLAAGASVGYHSAIFWAHNAMKGNRRALAELEEMGIDFKDVQRQGGKLTEEQLTKGVFHYTNNRLLVRKSGDNSLYQNKNFFLRGAFMFHSFVNSEAEYLRHSMLKMLQANDYAGLAKFAGTLFVAFPMVAPWLKATEVLARTGSLQRARASEEEDRKHLFHPESFGEWAMTYIDMLSHIGASGAYFGYLNAIKARKLMESVVGPRMALAGEDIFDLVHPLISKSSSPLSAQYKPLERDILRQTIPVFGQPLAHYLAPTKADKEAGGEGSWGSSTSSNEDPWK